MSNSKITKMVFIRGDVLLKVQARKDAVSPIYEILAKAPAIIEDQYPMVYELTQSGIRKSPDNNFCDEFNLKVSGPVHRTLKETSNEVREFVNYLNSCKDILSAAGKIEVSEFNGNKDDGEETEWTIKIKNQNSTNI